MTTLKEIIQEVRNIFKANWTKREGRKVPDDSDIQLGNDAVTIKGTVLYADMLDSTRLVDDYKQSFAAEIYKTYLIGACRVIKNQGGEITAFDGDRVMAVFIGNLKNTHATKAALQINYLVREINTELVKQYPNTSYRLKQSIGIDTSDLWIAKTGIRNSNDLVWVGRAANYAAKLCTLGTDTYSVHITEDVFGVLADEAKFGGQPRRSMWEKVIWQYKGIPVYRSNWWWEF